MEAEAGRVRSDLMWTQVKAQSICGQGALADQTWASKEGGRGWLRGVGLMGRAFTEMWGSVGRAGVLLEKGHVKIAS